MNDDQLLELTNQIESTLGKENSAMIADSLGQILTGNSENMKIISEKNAEIKSLQERNEKLVSANGALLQKIPVSKSDVDEEVNDTPPKKINLKDAFDSKGNFIH